MKFMKNETVLVCDANFSTLPIVFALKQQGYQVACCGSLLTDPCHAIADFSFPIDYSDKSALDALVAEFKPDYLLSGCNDVSYLSAAWVAERRGYAGFDSYSVACQIHQKVLFRQLCQQYHYPSPRSADSVEAAMALQFPLIVKPTASFSGKGIEKFETPTEFAAYFKQHHFQPEQFVIEEFVSGQLYSHSAFIKSGQILTDFFVNEYCTVFPYQVNSSHLAAELSTAVKAKARLWLLQLAEDLALVDGLVHTQFLSDGDSFIILEVCRRCPGDLYSLLIQKSTGLNYAKWFSDGFMSQLPETAPLVEQQKFISRHTLSIDFDCFYFGSRLTLECVDMVNYQLKKTGERMKAAPFDKAGIYFVEHDSAKKMQSLTAEMRHFVDIECIRIEDPI